MGVSFEYSLGTLSPPIMNSLILASLLAVASSLPIEDTQEVIEAKTKFSAAFIAAEAGEHAALAPVNIDVQAPAPVFSGEQIPTAYLADAPEVAVAKAAHLATAQAEQIPALYIADTAEVAAAKAAHIATVQADQISALYIADTAEVAVAKAAHIATVQADQIPAVYIADTADVAVAKAAHLATVQAVQIPTSYIADTAVVVDAKATFKAAFDDAAAGGLAAKQTLAPIVAEVKFAAVAPAVTAPVVYAAAHPFYKRGLTYALPHKALTYTSLHHNALFPYAGLHYPGLQHAGFLPFVPAAVTAAEAPAVEAE